MATPESIAGKHNNAAKAEMEAVWNKAMADMERIAATHTARMHADLKAQGYNPGQSYIAPYSATTAIRKGGKVGGILTVTKR
jgi:hypothetical protein